MKCTGGYGGAKAGSGVGDNTSSGRAQKYCLWEALAHGVCTGRVHVSTVKNYHGGSETAAEVKASGVLLL